MPLVTSLQRAAILDIVKWEELWLLSFFGCKPRKLTFILQWSVWERRRPGDLFQKLYYNEALSVLKCAIPCRVSQSFPISLLWKASWSLKEKVRVGEKDFHFLCWLCLSYFKTITLKHLPETDVLVKFSILYVFKSHRFLFYLNSTLLFQICNWIVFSHVEKK